MHPTEGKFHGCIRALLHHLSEPSIGNNLHDAAEVGEMRGGRYSLAVLGIDLGSRRRYPAIPWPVTDGVAPEPAGFGSPPARGEYRQARVIANIFSAAIT
jgi:hypothetical protein